MPVLNDLFLEHLGASLARQKTLLRATEGLPCNIDLTAGRISFGERYTFPVQLLGREDETGTWTWGWALPGIPEPLLRAARGLESYGRQNGLDAFRVPSFRDEALGSDELAVLACGISQSDSFFIARTEEGLLFLLIPDLGGQIRRDTSVRFAAEVIAEMLQTYELRNPRPALKAYLRSEGYEIDETSPGQWTALHPGGSRITLKFDSRGRLAKLDGSDS